MYFDGIVTNGQGMVIGLKKNGKMLYNFKYYDYIKKMKEENSCDNHMYEYCNENEIDLIEITKDEKRM